MMVTYLNTLYGLISFLSSVPHWESLRRVLGRALEHPLLQCLHARASLIFHRIPCQCLDEFAARTLNMWRLFVRGAPLLWLVRVYVNHVFALKLAFFILPINCGLFHVLFKQSEALNYFHYVNLLTKSIDTEAVPSLPFVLECHRILVSTATKEAEETFLNE